MHNLRRRFVIVAAFFLLLAGILSWTRRAAAVEIPLDTLAPALAVSERHLGLAGVDDEHLVAIVGCGVDGVAGRQVAERLPEGHVLVTGERLVAEEEHLPLHERVRQLGR
jgi:hypothetical protein